MKFNFEHIVQLSVLELLFIGILFELGRFIYKIIKKAKTEGRI